MSVEKKCKVCGDYFCERTNKKTCSEKCTSHLYYLKNIDKIKNDTKIWKENNKEKAIQSSKKSMRKYVESGKMNAAMRKQYHKNKSTGKHQAREFTNYNRSKILQFRNNTCESCGSKENLEIHHISYDFIPFFRDFVIENMEKLNVWCKKCHLKYHKN